MLSPLRPSPTLFLTVPREIPREKGVLMATEKTVAHDPVLAAMEAKIAAWTKAAESYRAAMALDGPLAEPSSAVAGVARAGVARAGAPRPAAHELPVGVFRNKSIKDAIVLYLEACQRKQTNKEIAAGLQQGGIATTSKNFEPTVGTALHRLKSEGIVLRFPDGWDLAASYPDNLRRRLETDRAPKKPKRANKRKGKSTIKALPAPQDTADDFPKAV